LQTHQLIAHPAHRPEQVTRIEARVDDRDPDWLVIRWTIEGARSILVPPFAGRKRKDGLWQMTCFELFLASREMGGEGYRELNFSPSEAWAAYGFRSYRDGMTELALDPAPACSWRGGRSGMAIFDVSVPTNCLLGHSWHYGISAVIEEKSGAKSYWALHHSNPDKPDFHDPSCFVATLPAPEVS
jgi:hypothetical protein